MDAAHRWITDAIRPFQYDVASCVPPVFEAYARVFHPAYEIGHPVSWKTVAQANNRIAHPAMEWGSLVGSWDLQSQPGLWDQRPDTGRLPVPTTAGLSGVFKQCSRADGVLYALWNGNGGIEITKADLIELPNRPMYVIPGSIDDATEPFGIAGRTANLWWATDRQWCVATDIDLLTTYVGAGAQCIETILNNVALEAFPVTSDQRITWDADTINPLPDPPYRLPGYPSSL
ncbi:hypothetical protein [Mycobacterium sp.]|uniref:hypothetical protein n=1 Tax=Mycobacterium sp. TaxID=1785 RepID=UPI003C72DFDC